jgi:hypothetical protein
MLKLLYKNANTTWHEETRIVDDTQARISANFYGISNFKTDEVMISYNGVQVIKSNPIFTFTK